MTILTFGYLGKFEFCTLKQYEVEFILALLAFNSFIEIIIITNKNNDSVK